MSRQRKVNSRQKRSFRRQAYVHFQRCQWCNGAFDQDALTVDHVVPKSAGGSNDVANLCLSCKVCNNDKGAAVGRHPPFGPIWTRWFDPVKGFHAVVPAFTNGGDEFKRGFGARMVRV